MRELSGAAATEALGAALARVLVPGLVLYLHGELGAGKTTLTRGLLRALGVTGAVRSPTYTLIEPYDTAFGRIFHLDLYRITAAEELEYLGLRDLCTGDAALIVEWPERGAGVLPPADLSLRLHHAGEARRAELEALSPRAVALLEAFPTAG